MTTSSMGTDQQGRLLQILRGVRNRWRLRTFLRGLAVVALGALLVLAVSGPFLERMRFESSAVLGLRIGSWVLLTGLIAWFLVRPFLRRVTDEQVALYLEEHEPELGEAVVSAISLPVDSGASQALTAKLIQDAVDRCRRVNEGRSIERQGILRSGGVLGVVAGVAVLLLLVGPPYLRHGALAVFKPSLTAAESNPYSIFVEPGDITISRGSDQPVMALPNGFQADDATLYRRAGDATQYTPVPMIPMDSTGFEALMFGVDEKTDYFVESAGIRSDVHTVDVADLPYVDEMTLVYHFPPYTGLEPRVVEGGGDVAVLRGTRVEVQATPTIPTAAGRILVSETDPADLEPQEDGTLVGSFLVGSPGFYSIELQHGEEMIEGSPEYTIDVLEDQPPSITLIKPGRDTHASPIEEVFVEARADDDWGVGRIQLFYSLNGGPEDSVSVFGSRGTLKQVSAGHTFFLEEYELEPGDVLSYYARVRDNNRVGGSRTVTSDIYFLSIRPFRKDYSQSEQAGGQGQGGGEAGMEGALSEQQRQIISGTFNLVRDRDTYTDSEYGEYLTTIRLSQEKLRTEVDELVNTMKARGVAGSDPVFQTILEELPKAVVEMGVVIDTLTASRTQQALPPEQRALQHLLRAEEAYRDVQIQMAQQAGGGGGGGSSADELADLFELELDKMKNQYETVQREQQRAAGQQLDETLERLKELARRQEQAAERQRRLAQNGQGGAGGSSDAQRELAEEAEEAARELERLAREQQQPELEQTARQLREAAESMRRSAAASGNQSASDARDALEGLRDARRRLERERSGQLSRGAQQAMEQARRLAEEQAEIEDDVANLPLPGAERSEAVRDLSERKAEMENALQDLERQLDNLAADASSDPDQAGAARQLRGAADDIREEKITEKVRYTRAVLEQRPDQTTRPLEQQIREDLENLAGALEEASEGMTAEGPDAGTEALDRARDLVRGLESLDEQVSERADEAERARRLGQRGQEGEGAQGQNGEGEPGQEGQQGQEGQGAQGEPGQEGQQGQEGQAGQEGQGQQGQGGQEGQGGQQGQAGQPGSPNGQGGGASGFAPGGGNNTGQGGGEMTEEEIRQLQREFSQRLNDADQLRRTLDEAGVDATDLNSLIRTLRRLDDRRTYDDLEEVQRLQSQVLEGAKRLEFALRRAVEGEGDDLLLRGNGEAPPGWEKQVEEYYRSLARGRGR